MATGLYDCNLGGATQTRDGEPHKLHSASQSPGWQVFPHFFRAEAGCAFLFAPCRIGRHRSQAHCVADGVGCECCYPSVVAVGPNGESLQTAQRATRVMPSSESRAEGIGNQWEQGANHGHHSKNGAAVRPSWRGLKRMQQAKYMSTQRAEGAGVGRFLPIVGGKADHPETDLRESGPGGASLSLSAAKRRARPARGLVRYPQRPILNCAEKRKKRGVISRAATMDGLAADCKRFVENKAQKCSTNNRRRASERKRPLTASASRRYSRWAAPAGLLRANPIEPHRVAVSPAVPRNGRRAQQRPVIEICPTHFGGCSHLVLWQLDAQTPRHAGIQKDSHDVCGSTSTQPPPSQGERTWPTPE